MHPKTDESVEMRRSWHYDGITTAFKEKGRENTVSASAAVSVSPRKDERRRRGGEGEEGVPATRARRGRGRSS